MPQSTTDLADLGYTEAMRLMVLGRLRGVRLWRPEAFDRYRGAILDGAPNAAWLEQFNQDLQEEVDSEYSARFVAPDDAAYPAELDLARESLVVIQLTRTTSGFDRHLTVVIRPDADQVLAPITRHRAFP